MYYYNKKVFQCVVLNFRSTLSVTIIDHFSTANRVRRDWGDGKKEFVMAVQKREKCKRPRSVTQQILSIRVECVIKNDRLIAINLFQKIKELITSN